MVSVHSSLFSAGCCLSPNCPLDRVQKSAVSVQCFGCSAFPGSDLHAPFLVLIGELSIRGSRVLDLHPPTHTPGGLLHNSSAVEGNMLLETMVEGSGVLQGSQNRTETEEGEDQTRGRIAASYLHLVSLFQAHHRASPLACSF